MSVCTTAMSGRALGEMMNDLLRDLLTWISASVKSVDWFWSFLWVGQTTTSMPLSSKKCWHIWHIPAKYGSRLPYTEEHMVLCTSRWPNWWMALPCKRMAHLWTSCHSHEVCISQFCQKHAYMWPVGGHFVALKQRSFSSSFHKRADSPPSHQGTLHLPWWTGMSPDIFPMFLTLHGDTLNLLQEQLLQEQLL